MIWPLLAVIFSLPAFAQPPDTVWTQLFFNPDVHEIHDAVLSPEGGPVIIGSLDDEISENIQPFVLKYDQYGDTVWSRTYDNDRDNVVNAIAPLSAGGYVLSGYVYNEQDGRDTQLLQIREDGEYEWIRVYRDQLTDDEANEIAIAGNSGFVICGTGQEPRTHMRLARVDASGDTVWTRRYPLASNDRVWGLSIDKVPSGGFIVAGRMIHLMPPPPVNDCWVWRIADNGDTMWTAELGTERYSRGVKVRATPDGGFLMMGYTQQPDSFIRAILLVKLNSDGQVVWNRYLDAGVFWQEPFDLVVVGNTGFVIAGFERTESSQNYHPIVVRVASDGDILWTLHLRGFTGGQAKTVDVLDDGGYMITGDFFGPPWFVVRTEPDPVSADNTFIPQPSSFNLSVYPNPFNATTTFAYTLLEPSRVIISIVNTLGQQVCTANFGMQSVGEHRYKFSAPTLPSGVYLAHVSTKYGEQVKKAILLR